MILRLLSSFFAKTIPLVSHPRYFRQCSLGSNFNKIDVLS